MIDNEREALQLCEAGLQHMWKGDVDAAIGSYDRAAAVAVSDETRELITIRKAEALIAAERDGAEVAALPGIVMRRRSPRHVYLAAGTLMRRFVENDDRRKAIFYGEIARGAATELGEPMSRASVLNHLGITLIADSQFAPAIEVLNEALEAVDQLGNARDEAHSLRAVILGNLGGAQILSGDVNNGIRVLENVLPDMDEQYLIAEIYLDLCFGYLELERYDIAELYGRRALELATVKRQIRNGNHLLGEICLRTKRYEEADGFFDVVAGYYPDFKNVKQLLVAVDLCAVVNWKA
jgi:tetratricopeptide (TPR) repeat protein